MSWPHPLMGPEPPAPNHEPLFNSCCKNLLLLLSLFLRFPQPGTLAIIQFHHYLKLSPINSRNVWLQFPDSVCVMERKICSQARFQWVTSIFLKTREIGAFVFTYSKIIEIMPQIWMGLGWKQRRRYEDLNGKREMSSTFWAHKTFFLWGDVIQDLGHWPRWLPKLDTLWNPKPTLLHWCGE